ncbi:rhomboid domain-containing protein 2 [Bombina bombina]|uniref:rhomboid domain-containing protein 2 n=1 Tax=Bombina bombina TaxID=8345 RepID=UPI00235AFC81|nr:rhomboid domain-containing protein 2 [Bombina bombina]
MKEGDKAQSGSWLGRMKSWLPQVAITPGVAVTILASLAISCPGLLRVARGEVPGARMDLEAGILGGIDVHRLITYICFHEDLSSLVCSCLLIWYFGGGFEENMGTVKFFFLTPLFAVSSGLVYLAILATGLHLPMDDRVQGFTAVAFSMMCVFIARSSLKRLMFFGFMVPIKIMPLLFLLLALFIPHAPVLSNVCGILVGTVYGMGSCFFLDLPESLMSRLEQMLPFKLLKRLPFVKYIPATLAERNASQTRKINPPPGSYPTQQYYTPSPGLSKSYNPYHNARPTGTWPAAASVGSYPTQVVTGSPPQINHSCTAGHSHTEAHSSPGTSGVLFPSPGLQEVQTQA